MNNVIYLDAARTERAERAGIRVTHPMWAHSCKSIRSLLILLYDGKPCRLCGELPPQPPKDPA